MRILTVRQPWAWAIIHGGKNIENRTRNIAGAYRGPVAIHVAQRAEQWIDATVVGQLITPSTVKPAKNDRSRANQLTGEVQG